MGCAQFASAWNALNDIGILKIGRGKGARPDGLRSEAPNGICDWVAEQH